MSGNYYPGEYTSAIARARKVLIAAGFPWSTTKGRYQPFCNEQIVTAGVRVTRLGCSETVTISALEGSNQRYSRKDCRLIEALAIATLREAGLPFDDRGWLLCNVPNKKVT